MRDRLFRRIALCATALCLVPVFCLAQLGTAPAPTMPTSIRGMVRDAVTHHPLQHVVIMVEAEESGYAGQAQTDSGGSFDRSREPRLRLWLRRAPMRAWTLDLLGSRTNHERNFWPPVISGARVKIP